MEEQFRVIMDALAEIDRQAKDDRATLEAVRKYVDLLVNDRAHAIENLRGGLFEARGFYHAIVESLRTLLAPSSRATRPLTLVKP